MQEGTPSKVMGSGHNNNTTKPVKRMPPKHFNPTKTGQGEPDADD